jgi:hypothetical protein
MDAVYLWIQNHQLIMGLAMPIVLFFFGIICAPAKVIKWGFLTSQFVRRFLGAKAEKEFEQAIDEFEQGLHSDDPDKPSTPIIPLLLLSILLFGALQVQAKEKFNEPFAYLYMKIPPADMKVTDGLWVIKPAPSFSLIGVARGIGGYFIASPFCGSGMGVSIERLISVNGDFFTSFSLSFNGLFSPIPDTKDFKFSGSMLIGTNIYPLGIIGIGPGFDGKTVSFVIGYEGGFKF